MKPSRFIRNVGSVLFIAVLFGFVPVASGQAPDAAEAPTAADPDPLVYKDPTGVTVEFNKDGSDWVRIRSIGEAALILGDNRDIQDAVRKAELKAKASISNFLTERVKAKDVSEEMSKTMTDHNGTDQTANRKTVDTLTTRISSSSDSILQGVLLIEQKTDKDAKMVSVTVGVSRKSMGVADALRNSINTDQAAPAGGKPDNTVTPGSETRRSKNYDDF